MRPVEWDERVEIGPRARWFWDPVRAQHVGRYLWARTRIGRGQVLDVACGSGYGSALLAGSGRHVLGIDLSSEAVDRANRHYASANVRFMVGDATRLPVATSSVDCVVSFETIEHLAEPAAFVTEIARVLRPGGMLLLSTPDRAIYSRGRTDGRSNNPFHPSEMTCSELLDVLQKHLVVRELLGQSEPRESAIRDGPGEAPRWSDAVRMVAKGAVKLVTAPVLRSESIAHWLFPLLRRRYVPIRWDAGRFTYIVVRAEKPRQ